MQTANPYSTPAAPVADPSPEGVSTINIWSAKGRLGRIRYIGYSVGLGLLINVVSSLLAGMSVSFGVESIVYLVGLAGGLFVHALLSIQRAHDFNATGWLAVLAFIPLLNFIFWFIPGTEGENRFGHKTPPNSKLAIVLACIIPAVMVLGIVAAIAIPAYPSYVQSTPTVQAE